MVTGRPGIGKTTAVLRAAEELRRRGLRIGGMVSREVRRGGVRVGFIVSDLMTGEEGYLAKVGRGEPRVGKYVVLVGELERVGVAAIRRALQGADVVVIDEIGPMELYSEEFKAAVAEALDSPRPVVATIHVRAGRYPFGRAVLSRSDCTLLRLTLDNRGSAPLRIVELVLRALGRVSGEG